MRALDAARRRVAGEGTESGFALLYVLFVTVMVMLGTAAMLTVTVGNIGPARKSQDTYAAQAAAQSGIQDFVANLNANCRTYSVQTCSWLAANPTVAGSLNAEQSYSATAVNPTRYLDANGGTVRVVSTGRGGSFPRGGASVKLTADVSAKPSVLRFTYFSNYETLGTKFLDAYYPDRTIPITDPAVADAVGLPTNSIVHWNGTGTAPANGYGDAVCDALYYDHPSNPSSLSNKGRFAVAGGRAGLAVGADFSEDGYTRTPAQSALGALAGILPGNLDNARTKTSRDAACEVRFTKGQTFTGPVYSRDAILMTNGEVGSTTGPSFTVPSQEALPAVTTGWSAGTTPAVTDPAKPYRTDPMLDGVPTTTATDSRQLVQNISQPLTLPSSADPNATCTYTGPTRIVLSGTTASVWSPLTTVVPGSRCYPSNGSGSGVVNASVPVTSTTIKVQDATTGVTGRFSFPDGLVLDGLSGSGGDITDYSRSRGDIYVEGKLTDGRLSLVAANDIVVTGDLTTTGTPATNSSGERSWAEKGAMDLVATNNVRLWHPVSCRSGTAADGYCPNDISGLYANASTGIVVGSDGALKDVHPSRQYVNVNTAANRRIDAAVIALNGSFLTDNFNRGAAMGEVRVNGGVYANHRGATGQLWEIPTRAVAITRPSSGYKLQIAYLSYTSAGLPFVPVLAGGEDLGSAWYVLNVSTGGAS